MKKLVATAVLLLLLLNGAAAMGEQRWISEASKKCFADLLTDLVRAYETPAGDDDARIDDDLNAIRQVSATDYEIAYAIAEHWRDVYLDDEYPLFLYRKGDTTAKELEQTSLRDSRRHAFVVLGYELMNGEMQPELKGRCAAAAAAARSYPSTIIVCSGGATGDNNPSLHTEAGMMRDYLVKRCGIEASRIHIDESAMTTLENASNTIEMLQQQGIETMTIVTSTYHQRWGQAVYNAVAVLYRRYFGYSVTIEYNYCFDTEPEHEIYRNDDRLAIRQIAQLLNVPMERQ
jgi:hypothetical protein